MKSHYFSTILFILFLFISTSSFSQTDCGNNAGFEMGTTAGWVCKYGTYGATVWSGFCPNGTVGNCPTFPTLVDSIGAKNANGNDAPGTTYNDRHTIMTKNYRPWAGANMGMDSISNNTVPVVNTNGGNYSFRLGDEVPGSVGVHPNRLARAEAIRLTFSVTSVNSVFHFGYSVFLQDPGHYPEEQPRFEVLITMPDSGDKIVPGGSFNFVAGSSNPSCLGTRDSSGFKYGIGQWRYTEWTDVCKDLSGYIGQNISVEFRASDCFPSQNITYSSAGVQTTCNNVLQPNGIFLGICCWGSPQACSTVSTCGIHASATGSHSSYAYIDAYCMPNTSVCNTDIKEIKDQNVFRIYPNPINSSSVLELSSPVMNAELIIYDVLGKELFRKNFSGLKTEIKKEDLDAGVYFVKVEEGEKRMTGKIVVE